MLLIFPFHAEILKTQVFVYSEMIISLCLDLVCVYWTRGSFSGFLSRMRWLWLLILGLPFGDITWVLFNLLSLLIVIDYVEVFC